MDDWFLDVSSTLFYLLGAAALGPLQFGFHLAELNAPQDVITCKREAIDTELPDWVAQTGGRISNCIRMSNAEFATISAMFTVGGFFTALIAGPYSAKYGRPSAMRIASVLFFCGSLLEAFAPSILVFSLGRLISGFGAGSTTVVVPIYIHEISPPRKRGIFGAITQISTNVGILAAQILGYYMSYGKAWRYMLGTGVLFASIQATSLVPATDSPLWLLQQGRFRAAKEMLYKLRSDKYDISEETASWPAWDRQERNSEREALLAATRPRPPPRHELIDEPDRPSIGFFEAVKSPEYRPAIIAVVGVMFAQQLNGINAMVMYSVSLLTDVAPISSSLLAISFSAVNLVATVVFSPLPDKIGRKPCILISIIGQGLCSFTLALSIKYEAKVLSAVMVVVFVAFFAFGLGPVPFILGSELVDREAVAATQSWSLASNYVATFLVAQLFPIINAKLNEMPGEPGRVFYIFFGFSVVFTTFVAFMVPETLRK